MTDFSKLVEADKGQQAHTIHLVDPDSYEGWLKKRSTATRELLKAQSFSGGGYEYAIIPGKGEDDWSVVSGVANIASLSSWCLAKLGESLPGGRYRLAADGEESGDPAAALFGWMTAQYRFSEFTDPPASEPRILLTPRPSAIDKLVAEAEATAMVCDLVNLPAGTLGPEQLEARAAALASEYGATINVVRGDALETGYPLVHAVGRAAARSHAPRLIELEWGDAKHPRVAIVGKGVCFDSGGLDIKGATGMRLMKKDMGGAAHALALARLVMGAKLPVRLHCVVPAVENAVSSNALRPGDVVKSRTGVTVEIDNTDAEGRLILADAIARTCEEKPELLIDFATLTGAARVALGPDLPALFCSDDAFAEQLLEGGEGSDDPLWRMPLFAPYKEMLSSDIADTANAGGKGMAGSVTAALFLQMFVTDELPWAHFDTYAWRQAAKPGRAKGGAALGLRAAMAALRARYAA